jgi:hypothetical protein
MVMVVAWLLAFMDEMPFIIASSLASKIGRRDWADAWPRGET